MDILTHKVDDAINSNSIATLNTIFASPAYLTLGSGEQRTLHAYFLKSCIQAPNSQSFLPLAFASPDFLQWLEQTCLHHLPLSVKDCADNQIRKALFEYLISDSIQQYEHGARILGTLRMDEQPESSYYYTPSDKTNVYVQIAECYLVQDQYEAADSAVTKAGTVLSSLSDQNEIPRALRLRYKSTYARVLDASRKFQQAAMQYYELSQAKDDANEEELMVMLGRAATCAILAPSGSQRQVVLGLICNDDRFQNLEHIPNFQTHSALLQKMYNHQILYTTDFTKFQSTLSPHQQAIGADGFSILQRSIMEHNMTAISKLYTNIYFADLAKLLGGVTEEKAVEMAARMIVSQGLKASMDEVEGLLTFEDMMVGDEEGYDLVGREWDETITNLCVQLNEVTDALKLQ